MEGMPITAAHDADGPALIGAGEAQHPADGGDLADVLQKGFGDELGRSGSPGIRTVLAKSPGSAAMWGVDIQQDLLLVDGWMRAGAKSNRPVIS